MVASLNLGECGLAFAKGLPNVHLGLQALNCLAGRKVVCAIVVQWWQGVSCVGARGIVGVG